MLVGSKIFKKKKIEHLYNNRVSALCSADTVNNTHSAQTSAKAKPVWIWSRYQKSRSTQLPKI